MKEPNAKKCMLGLWNSLNHFDNKFSLICFTEKVYGSSPYSPTNPLVNFLTEFTFLIINIYIYIYIYIYILVLLFLFSTCFFLDWVFIFSIKMKELQYIHSYKHTEVQENQKMKYSSMELLNSDILKISFKILIILISTFSYVFMYIYYSIVSFIS